MGVMKRLAYEKNQGRERIVFAYPERDPPRLCPTGCGAPLQPWQLLCFECYAKVPAELAHRMNRANRQGHGDAAFHVAEAVAVVNAKRARKDDEEAAGQPLLF